LAQELNQQPEFYETYLIELLSLFADKGVGIQYRASDIRYLSSAQVIFILTLHDIESMRSAVGFPSPLVSYFINNSLNEHPGLSACMDAVAEKVRIGERPHRPLF
jgi:hypothetical protein